MRANFLISSLTKGWRLTDVVVGLLLAASLCTSLVLGIKVSKLEGILSARAPRTELQTGDQVPALTGTLLDGTPVTLRYGDASVPTVLYVFTPQCIWCQRNLENFRRVAEAAKGRFRVIGVSLTTRELREHVSTSGFQFPVIHEIGSDMSSAYRLGSTPQTIVVGSDGEVQKNWLGAYTGDVRRDVEEFFDVKLVAIAESRRERVTNSVNKGDPSREAQEE
jgi:peroxiredoxin